MRSLRASALTRPPPRKLFDRHNLPPESQPDTHNSSHTPSSTSQLSAVRTLHDVNQFLRLRRASGDGGLQAPSAAQPRALSDKAAQRLSRIFTSRPPQAHGQSEN